MSKVKSIWSVKGILVVLVLALVTISSGTALASRQSAVSPQASQDRTDGASIVTSNLCTATDGDVSIWGSGFGAGELILLSVVVGDASSVIWYSGAVNEAGAFVVSVKVTEDPPNGNSAEAVYPATGLFTLEALGISGRLATTPIIFAEEKCA
jgi:hypothetical protein